MIRRSRFIPLCAFLLTGLLTSAQARPFSAIRADGTLHILAPMSSPM